MEKDLCRGGCILHCYVRSSLLFPYFLPFWYPYILLHFQMFFITCPEMYQCKMQDGLKLACVDVNCVSRRKGNFAYSYTRGGSERGVLSYAYAGLLPQCIEARSADQSSRTAENFFSLYFSVIRMGSRGTFVLCTASSRCKRICRTRGRHVLPQILLTQRNVIRTRRSWSRSQAVRFQPGVAM